MEVTLTKIFDKNKTSERTGKAYVSRSIKTNEHGDKWISGFKGKENEGWREGDTVEVEIETKGEYLNFSVPKGGTTRSNTPGAGDLNRVEAKLDLILAGQRTLGEVLTGMRGVMSDILSKVDPVGDKHI